MEAKSAELIGIQYLRGIAAIMVLVFHVSTPMRRVSPSLQFPDWLQSGVDIFFVISGLIMWVSTINSNPTTLQFYARRAQRIIPLYWFLTAIVIATQFFLPTLMQSSSINTWHTISSFLFIPSIHPVTGDWRPVLVPGWTLNLEVVFYAIFGLTLPLRPAYRLAIVVFAMSSFSICGFIFKLTGVELFYCSTLMLEFAIGLMIGALITHCGFIYHRLWLVAIPIGFICLSFSSIFPSWDRLFSYGFPAAFIVVGAINIDKATARRSRFLKMIGDASYSIYLVSGIALSAAGTIWIKLFPINNSLATSVFFAIFAIFFAVSLGLSVFFIVERKLHPSRILQHFRYFF